MILFIAFYFSIFFHYAHSLPGLEPVASPGPQTVNSPAPESALAFNSISLSPSSEPPSGSELPSNSESPLGSEPGLEFPTGLPKNIPVGPWDSKILQPIEAESGLKKICDSTDDPPLCVSTISPFLQGKTDLVSVTEVALKTSKELAVVAFSVMSRIASAPGNPPKVASILNACRDSYDDALYNFENAMTAFSNRDIGTTNTMLSAIITDIGDCEDGIAESNSSFPISQYSDKLSNMTSNCLSIVSLIE